MNKPPADRVEIVEVDRKGWRWILYANGKACATSVETYRRASDAARGYRRLVAAEVAYGLLDAAVVLFPAELRP